MALKTTVAIDPLLRKKIKQLAAKMDVSQGEIIKMAITEFEKKLISGGPLHDQKELQKKKIKQEMHKFTEMVWAEDAEVKSIQEKLNIQSEEEGREIELEDIIIRNWKTGLEEWWK